MRLSRRILAVLTALALLPLAGILLTALLAGTFGCEVSEAGPSPCVILGVDAGDGLSAMLTMGWFGLLTIPFLMLLVGLWSLVEAYVWGRQRRKSRRVARETNA
jgi:hypothetical protein